MHRLSAHLSLFATSQSYFFSRFIFCNPCWTHPSSISSCHSDIWHIYPITMLPRMRSVKCMESCIFGQQHCLLGPQYSLSHAILQQKKKSANISTIMIKIKSKSNYVSVCRIRVDVDATGRWVTDIVVPSHSFFISNSACFSIYTTTDITSSHFSMCILFFIYLWLNSKFFWFHIFTARLHLKFNIKYCMIRKS